ncbi:MAG: hypothetical protein DSY50_03635 [Desulfobulbus sp.]|nr:MAG: hypothetical protein DSY50_03635 [Desulfobulbus sp.]
MPSARAASRAARSAPVCPPEIILVGSACIDVFTGKGQSEKIAGCCAIIPGSPMNSKGKRVVVYRYEYERIFFKLTS